jgi:hypothetical protein
MSETAKPEQHPFERFREAMKKLVKVPKAEILRRESEYRERRKAERKNGSDSARRDS